MPIRTSCSRLSHGAFSRKRRARPLQSSSLRQPNGERRPILARGGHVDFATVCRHDCARDEQAQADAARGVLGLTSGERLEDERQHIRRKWARRRCGRRASPLWRLRVAVSVMGVPPPCWIAFPQEIRDDLGRAGQRPNRRPDVRSASNRSTASGTRGTAFRPTTLRISAEDPPAAA